MSVNLLYIILASFSQERMQYLDKEGGDDIIL
jgi:hypothetical protein